VLFYFEKRGGGLMNLKGLSYKLQKALLQKGRKIKINQTQHYSEEKNKMYTKYVLKEYLQTGNKKKDVTLLESFSLIDVVNRLVDMLNGGE
jgi:hypothetical protein